jgi:hypothetical protein
MFEGSIEPLDLDFAVLIADEFSPAARSARIADFAREQLAAAQATNAGRARLRAAHQTVVDGAAGISEDHVRPDGVIVYTFELLGELFAWISEQLRAHAPVRSGRFRDSFELFADGVLVDPPARSRQRGNMCSCRRSLCAQDRGLGARPPESRQAPDGVFEAVAALAAQRFGNQALIRFSFRAPLGERWLAARPAKISACRRSS